MHMTDDDAAMYRGGRGGRGRGGGSGGAARLPRSSWFASLNLSVFTPRPPPHVSRPPPASHRPRLHPPLPRPRPALSPAALLRAHHRQTVSSSGGGVHTGVHYAQTVSDGADTGIPSNSKRGEGTGDQSGDWSVGRSTGQTPGSSRPHPWRPVGHSDADARNGQEL